MDTLSHFERLLDATRAEGRYRTFVELERIVGAFPRARWHRSDGTNRLVDVGACLMVTPHADAALVAAAKARGMATLPGVATPTEGFAAVDAGADGLKVFPAGAVPPTLLRQWRSVFPPDVAFCPTGGVGPEDMEGYVASGAGGFGLGTGLYRTGVEAPEVRLLARTYVSKWRTINLTA